MGDELRWVIEHGDEIALVPEAPGLCPCHGERGMIPQHDQGSAVAVLNR